MPRLFTVPRVGSGMAWPLVGQQGGSSFGPHGSWASHSRQVGGSGRACPEARRPPLPEGPVSAFFQNLLLVILEEGPLGFHTAILEAPGAQGIREASIGVSDVVSV